MITIPSTVFAARKSSSVLNYTLKILMVLVATFACGSILASCSPSQSNSSGTTTLENVHITVGYKATHLVPELVVAQNQGLFEANGLTVELVPFDGSTVDASLNNDVDFIVGDPVTLEAACEGLPVKVVDVLHTGGIQGVARTNSMIGSVADLAGKKVCIPETDSFVRLMLDAELVNAGIDSSAVQWMPYQDGNVVQAYTDLKSGAIDAIVWPDPCGDILQQAGFVRFYDSANSEVLGNSSTTYVMAAASDAENDSGAASRLSVALEDAGVYIQQHPEDTAALLDADTSTTIYRELSDATAVPAAGSTDLYVNLIGNYQWNPGMSYFDESVRKGIWVALYASQEFRTEVGLAEMDASADAFIDESATAISVFGGRG